MTEGKSTQGPSMIILGISGKGNDGPKRTGDAGKHSKVKYFDVDEKDKTLRKGRSLILEKRILATRKGEKGLNSNGRR